MDLFGDAFFNVALHRANNLKDAFLIARSLVLRRELREGLSHRTRRWLAVEKWSPCWWRTPWASPEWLRNRLHEQQSVGSRVSNHLPVPPPPPQWTGHPSRGLSAVLADQDV